MNRRGFLKCVLGAAALPVAVRVIPASLISETPKFTSTYLMGKNAVVGGYADYLNLSDLVFATNPALDLYSKQLAYRLGEQIDALCRDQKMCLT